MKTAPKTKLDQAPQPQSNRYAFKARYTMATKSTVSETGDKSATKSTVAVYGGLCCRYGTSTVRVAGPYTLATSRIRQINVAVDSIANSDLGWYIL